MAEARLAAGKTLASFDFHSVPMLSKAQVMAVAELIGLTAKFADEYGSWENLHKVLAERLARICRRPGLPRLALYSFRHTAIATWKRAGMEPVAIASLPVTSPPTPLAGTTPLPSTAGGGGICRRPRASQDHGCRSGAHGEREPDGTYGHVVPSGRLGPAGGRYEALNGVIP
jgi:hypothetical protein